VPDREDSGTPAHTADADATHSTIASISQSILGWPSNKQLPQGPRKEKKLI